MIDETFRVEGLLTCVMVYRLLFECLRFPGIEFKGSGFDGLESKVEVSVA